MRKLSVSVGFYRIKVMLIHAIPLVFFFLSVSLSAQESTVDACTEYALNLQDMAAQKTWRVDQEPFKNLQGKTIRHISFHQLTIFDEKNPDENNQLYLLFNSLHIKTRKDVIESQILFHPGDKINDQVIDESARNLRMRKYLSTAFILPERVCGDMVDVAVITQDAWAIMPQVAYSHKSNDNQSGFGINDGNILGTGNSFTVGYSQSQLRNTVSYDFSNPYFLNRQVSVHALYQDTSDGRNSLLAIEHPFYSLDSPWASGMQWSDLSQTEEIRSHGVVENSFRHRAIDNELYVGEAIDINANYSQRLLMGWAHEEDVFWSTSHTLQNIPAHDKSVYPWLEYQYLENRYVVFKNLNQIQRPEDVAMGQTATFRLGMAGTAFGNPDDVIRYKGDYINIMDISERQLLSWELVLDGKHHMGINDLDPSLLSSTLSYYYFQDEKNRWYAELDYAVGDSLPQYKELTVGDITGLRGYPTDYLRGNKRYVFTLERRYFSDVHLFNLMRLGGVIFFDTGKAWGLNNEPQSPLLSDVGIGLRLSSSKVRIGNVIHVDIAFPTSAAQGLSRYQLTIGAQQKF